MCVLWAPDSLLCPSEFTLPDARVRARGKDSVGTGPSPKSSLEQRSRDQDAAAEILGMGEGRGRKGGREGGKERQRADKNRGGAGEKHRGTLKNTVIRAEGKRDKERLAGAREEEW